MVILKLRILFRFPHYNYHRVSNVCNSFYAIITNNGLECIIKTVSDVVFTLQSKLYLKWILHFLKYIFMCTVNFHGPSFFQVLFQ